MSKKVKHSHGCTCGRSPVERCTGWHRLSESGYIEMFERYKNIPEDKKEEFFKNNKVPK